MKPSGGKGVSSGKNNNIFSLRFFSLLLESNIKNLKSVGGFGGGRALKGFGVEKVSRADENRLNLFKFILELFFLILLLCHGGVLVYQAVFSRQRESVELLRKRVNPEAIKYKATIELISVKLNSVLVYTLSNQRKLVLLDGRIYPVMGLEPSLRYSVFFYRREDAVLFMKKFLQKYSGIQPSPIGLGSIYQQYKTPGALSNYVVFFQDEGKWVGIPFQYIPVYFPKNLKTKTPYFSYKNDQIVSIPYFFDRNTVISLVKGMGPNWGVGQTRLVKIAEDIPRYEFGQAITVIPPK